VKGTRLGVPVQYFGKFVALSAGVDNAQILRRAGISRAGKGVCCDAGVMPSALGLPVMWTVVALGKRLGKHLDVRSG